MRRTQKMRLIKTKFKILIFVVVLAFVITSCGKIIKDTFAQPDKESPVAEEKNTPDQVIPVTSPEPEEIEPEEIVPEELISLDFNKNTAEELIVALSNFSSPIVGRRVTTAVGQLPNAPRTYRNGVHQGLDYYDTTGKTVVVAARGKVIRVDHGYVEMTIEEYNEVILLSQKAPITPEELLDKLRGRQVWVEHENGVITRYCHLSAILPELQVGDIVQQGQAIATVGSSGTLGNIELKNTNPSIAPHLHFEIWHENVFLGKDRPSTEVRKIYSGILDKQ